MNAAQQPAPITLQLQLQLTNSPQSVLQQQLAVAQQTQLGAAAGATIAILAAAGVRIAATTVDPGAGGAGAVHAKKLALAQIQNTLLLQQLTIWQQQLQTALQQADPDAAAGYSPALSDTSCAKPAQSTSSRPLATRAVSRSWIKSASGIGTSASAAASRISP